MLYWMWTSFVIRLAFKICLEQWIWLLRLSTNWASYLIEIFKVKIVKQIHRIELSCHWTLAGHLCIIKKHVELYCRARELDPKNYITAPFFASQFLNLWHLPFVLWKVQLCTRVTFKHNHQRIWRKLDYCLNLKGQFSIHCSYRSCLAWGCYRQPNRGASHCHDKDMNLHWLQTT